MFLFSIPFHILLMCLCRSLPIEYSTSRLLELPGAFLNNAVTVCWVSLRCLWHVMLYGRIYNMHINYSCGFTGFLLFMLSFCFRRQRKTRGNSRTLFCSGSRDHCQARKRTASVAKPFIWVYIHLKSIKGTLCLWWSVGAIRIWNAANAVRTTTSSRPGRVSLQLA